MRHSDPGSEAIPRKGPEKTWRCLGILEILRLKIAKSEASRLLPSLASATRHRLLRCWGLGVRVWGFKLQAFGLAAAGSPFPCSRLKPYTPHSPPCILHPAPCTLHPSPCTLYPAPCTLHLAAGLGTLRVLGAISPSLFSLLHFHASWILTLPALSGGG